MCLLLGKSRITSFDSQISTGKTLATGEGVHSMKTYDHHPFTSGSSKQQGTYIGHHISDMRKTRKFYFIEVIFPLIN